MAILKPAHTVVVYRTVSEYRDDGVRYAGTWETTGRRIVCQLAPASATTVFDRYGIEVRRPYLLLADPGEFPYLSVGAKVVWEANGESYVVRSSQRFDVGALADHCEAVLENL